MSTREGQLGCTDCERLREGPVAQPVNTATSLAFVAAGGAVLVRQRRSARRTEVAAFAALLGLVGAGSVAFHGPQPRGAKAMHDWPIAGLLALTAATPAVRLLAGRRALPGLTRGRGLVLSGVVAAAAAAYSAGRTSSPACDPDSPLQWHGVWHVLAAAGFLGAASILYDDRTRA